MECWVNEQKSLQYSNTPIGRRELKFIGFTLFALVLALSAPVATQQAAKTPRIGYLATTGQGDAAGTFQRGLRDLGYVEGKNIAVEYRYHEGKMDRISNFVAELVQLKVDALVADSPPAIFAAKEATRAIPIVMVINEDPVAMGLIDSLARPGGNITGVSRLTRDLAGKRLELLKEIIPGMSRVGVLWNADGSSLGFKAYEAAARALRVQLDSLPLGGASPNLEAPFLEAIKRRTNAIIVPRSIRMNRYRRQIADLAIKNRMPSMYEGINDVERGGLVSYSADDAEGYKRAAWYVDKILKGAKPADLPVEQPTKFELVFNSKTAKQIGLTIPPNVLARADRVIR
jgi:putative ABC transport system substrate-binding protein